MTYLCDHIKADGIAHTWTVYSPHINTCNDQFEPSIIITNPMPSSHVISIGPMRSHDFGPWYASSAGFEPGGAGQNFIIDLIQVKFISNMTQKYRYHHSTVFKYQIATNNPGCSVRALARTFPLLFLMAKWKSSCLVLPGLVLQQSWIRTRWRGTKKKVDIPQIHIDIKYHSV